MSKNMDAFQRQDHAEKMIESPLENPRKTLTDTFEILRDIPRSYDVDTSENKGALYHAERRLEEARDNYNTGQVDVDVSEDEAEEALRNLSLGASGGLTGLRNAKDVFLEQDDRTPGQGYTVGTEGRAEQAEDALAAASYLAEEATDQEIVRAAVAMDNGEPQMQYGDKDLDRSHGLEHDFETEAQRAMDIIDQFAGYEQAHF